MTRPNATPASEDELGPRVRAFLHSRKGRLVGRVLREVPDSSGGAWVDIKLTRPTVWRRGARRTRLTIAPGDVVTFRKALATEVEP